MRHAFKASDRELGQLPAALVLLLEIISQEQATSSRLLRACVKALGCTLVALTPHAPPGHVPEVDRGVQALIAQLLRQTGVNAPSADEEDSWWRDGDGYSSPVGAAQAAAEAIGRMALTSSQWRPVLCKCAMQALISWIRSGVEDRKFHKYLFWAAAAMSGMPFVASELKLHISNVSAVDAALCTIIDILDEDIDGEYTLAGADRGEAEMPSLLALVVEAMKVHSSAPEVQARGAACVGLLVPYVPLASLQTVAPAAIVAVLNGARRFPRRTDVVSGASAALRSLCEMCRRRRDASLEALVATLRQENAADCVEQAFCSFARYTDCTELLEDAAAVAAQLSGVEALLERLSQEPATSQLRVAGLKALFEEGRLDLDFFSRHAASAAIKVCEQMVMEASQYNSEKDPSEPPIDTTRLHEVASLLSGLCSGRLRAMCA
ncbi:unnamed protein product [Effrenium voratum]|nr:unnamed protein product [Effrenium voratum]